MDEVTASDLKVELKKWESDFKDKNGRKPSKTDISQADSAVQEKYKKYCSLKRTLQMVDVWGIELNKDNSAKKEQEVKQNHAKTPSFSIAQKLWENSKSIDSSHLKIKSSKSKRLNMSIARDENMGALNCPKLSTDGVWQKEDTPRPQNLRPPFLTTSSASPPQLKFGSPPPVVSGSAVKALVPAALPNEQFMFQPKKGSMFEKALQLTQSSRKGTASLRGTEEVYNPVVNKHPVTAFRKIDVEFLNLVEENFEAIETPFSMQSSDVTSFRSTPECRLSVGTDKPSNEAASTKSKVDVHSDTKEALMQRMPIPNTDDAKRTRGDSTKGNKRKGSCSSPTGQPERSQTPRSTECFKDEPFIEFPDAREELPVRKRLRTDLHGFSIIKDGNIEHQPSPASDCASTPVSAAQKSSADSPVSKASEDSDMDEESSDQHKKKPAAKKSRASKMAPSKSLGGGGGNLSTNYVRLNMKVKSYRRRGGGRTGGQMKRLLWKQKMASRANSRGGGCFKCGQEGHWAKNCKGKKSSAEPMEDDSGPPEDETLPSLSDALRMAHGKPKRKPRQQKTAAAETQRDKDSDDDDSVAANILGDQEEADCLEEFEFVRQRASERDEAVSRPPPTEPLYHLTDTGEVPDAPPAVYKALSTFGYKAFRPGQETSVMRILCGQTTLVQLATGAGKSLCYQLPALMYAQRSNCLTLCISPLVSLMEDQVSNLPAGLKGACLHTNMTKPAREKVAEAVIAGDIHFLLLSPEALISTGVRLLDFTKLPPIAFACIDEAHCVSAWSHNFRPSYLRVCKVLRERLGVQCILGLTATATRATALNVAEHIGTQDGERAFIRGAAIPDCLVLSVSRDEDRDRALLELLQAARFASCHSIIIYCTRRQTTERLAALIRTTLKDIKHTTKVNKNAPQSKSKKAIQVCEEYHAGLPAHSRKRVQLQFMNGTLRIVVATVAFGMGLDKQDVHGIIHYNLPRNFESYVQEIGRAGRDGVTSHCHVFLDERGGDVHELRRHIFADTVDRHTVKKFIQWFFPPCRCQELEDRFADIKEGEEDAAPTTRHVCPGHERAVVIEKLVQELDMKEEGISTLLCYLELDEKRLVEILSPVYATCLLTSHSGRPAFTAAAKKCPALAVAMAQLKVRGQKWDGRSITFPVVEVADSLGTTSGVVKREISGLKWTRTHTGGYQRSAFLIEYADLAFHIRCRGDLSDDEVDDLVDLLYERIVAQEKNELEHLYYFYNVIHSVAHKNYYMCADEADLDRSDRLKVRIRKYFDINRIHLPTDDSIINKIQQPEVNEDAVCADVRHFVHTYAEEHTLTARSITRIFHGIASPNFPPEVWGRVRRFWRCHLDVEFNYLLRLVKRTLLSTK